LLRKFVKLFQGRKELAEFVVKVFTGVKNVTIADLNLHSHI